MATRRKYETKDEIQQGGLVAYIKRLIHKPIDLVFSQTAVRAYLTSFLVASAALILFGIAVLAYTVFYWSYIPRIGFERTIYLQFDNVYHNTDSRYDGAGNPYGMVTLSPDLVSLQKYEVSVELMLPRTPENRDAGNFMVEATMYAPGSVLDPMKDSVAPGKAEVDNRLARSRRPSILPYRSFVLEYLYRLTELHWYILGWRSEADKLTITMWENLEFVRGLRNVPSTMKLEIQSTHRMQVYSAKAMFRARFTGLRWLMYHYRIISATIFVTSFWTIEMVFAGLAWATLSFYLRKSNQEIKPEQTSDENVRVKEEADDDIRSGLSDTERTFPTTSKQAPLHYTSPPIKLEDEETVVLPEVPNKGMEADDEDEDMDVFLDSGIGTSMESSATRRDSMRKRRGRPRPGDDYT